MIKQQTFISYHSGELKPEIREALWSVLGESSLSGLPKTFLLGPCMAFSRMRVYVQRRDKLSDIYCYEDINSL